MKHKNLNLPTEVNKVNWPPTFQVLSPRQIHSDRMVANFPYQLT